jgi:hypothetical protein
MAGKRFAGKSSCLPIEWTGSDPELSLRLDRALGEPLRVQVERALRQSTQSGRLEAG